MASAKAPAGAPKPSSRDRGNIAKHVARVTDDLAYMARAQGLDALGYLLEMAKLEAESVLKSEDAWWDAQN